MTRFLFGLLLALAACHPGPPDAAPPPVASPPATAPPTDTPPAPPVADRVALALDPDGLRFVDPTSGSTRPLAFGTERGGVVSALDAAGREVVDGGENAECGAGPLAFATLDDALTLSFSDGTFVGWSLASTPPRSATFSTMTGLTVGSTRTALDDDYRADVRESTLGTEFYTGGNGLGGLSGLLDGPGPDATVTSLWAGTVCTFR